MTLAIWPTLTDDPRAIVSEAPMEESADTERQVSGLICPRCYRKHEQEDDPSGDILRCLEDGYAFVAAEALADADGDPFLGTTIAGRYVIIDKLGAGSMGTVYKARHEAMGRFVAVKILRSDRILDTQSQARFEREARAMSLLKSPHTVTVYDFGEIPPDPVDEEFSYAGPSLYLAMEMLEGESLGHRLTSRGRLRIDEAVRITRHALLSLIEAHEKGVIHRDLKPDNLFLARTSEGEYGEICKVLDFGIAKVLSDTSQGVDALETQAGAVFGTPRYMSPEQAQGKPLDARSDLYTLGVLLYQMLVGYPPFTDDDAVVVMAHHIKTDPLPPAVAAPDARIPKPLSDLVVRVIAKDPNARPHSAREFLAQLDQAYERVRKSSPPGGSGEDGLEPNSLSNPPAGAARHRVAIIVGGAVAVGVVGGLVAFGLSADGGSVPIVRAGDSLAVAGRLRLVAEGLDTPGAKDVEARPGTAERAPLELDPVEVLLEEDAGLHQAWPPGTPLPGAATASARPDSSAPPFFLPEGFKQGADPKARASGSAAAPPPPPATPYKRFE